MQITLQLSSTVSLQTQICLQVVEQIRTGHRKPGDVLPSSRELSRQLGVSRNTVLEAYGKLAAEGYINTSRAKGTFISRSLPDHAISSGSKSTSEPFLAATAINLPLPYTARGQTGLYSSLDTQIDIDFRFGLPDAQSFPQKTWRRLLVECLGAASKRITQYNDPAGLLDLRQLIADFLKPARGMSVNSENIIIVGGFQQGINLTAHLMVGENSPVAMEAPTYTGAGFLFESYGGKVIPIPIDEFGIDVSRLPTDGIKLIYVTPSHQFPTGVTMSLERRAALLQWAAKTGTYILEVDYDADFRYEGGMLPSLHSMDRNECVIYLNSFSRSLGPGLRLGYMAVPHALIKPAVTIKSLLDNGSPWLEQITLSQFIKSGGMTKHLRQIRNTYRLRRDAVLVSVEKHFGEALISGEQAGTHMLWNLPNRLPSAQDLKQIAKLAGIGLHPLHSETVLYPDQLPDSERQVLLGYVHLKPVQIDEGLGRIAAALKRRK